MREKKLGKGEIFINLSDTNGHFTTTPEGIWTLHFEVTMLSSYYWASTSSVNLENFEHMI